MTAVAGCDSRQQADAVEGNLLAVPMSRADRLLPVPSGSTDDGIPLQLAMDTGTLKAAAKGRGSANARRSGGGAEGSPYGCIVSTLQADASNGSSYRYAAAYLYFPDEVVEASGGRLREVAVVLKDRRAPARASRRIERGEPADPGGVVRAARCRVPDADEAEPLVRRQVARFGPEAWAGSGLDAGASAGVTAASVASGPVVAAASETRCAEYEIWLTCTYPAGRPEERTCRIDRVFCARYVTVEDDPFGGGGGPPGPGDGEPCNYDGAGTSQLCTGGGGPVDTDPGPCDSPDPPPYCTNKCQTGDPVIDDVAVNKEFEGLVERSNHFAADGSVNPQQDRRETVFLVYKRRDGTRFTHRPVLTNVTPCGASFYPAPEMGGALLESYFHYHPFVSGEEMWTCQAAELASMSSFTLESYAGKIVNPPIYKNRPSSDDVEYLGILE